MDDSLSQFDIFDIAQKVCNVYTYPDLVDKKYIGELFSSINCPYLGYVSRTTNEILPFTENSCVILYTTKKNYGHWCILNKHCDEKGRTRYDFLDSYGEMIDDQLDYIPKKIRAKTNQVKAKLSELLSKVKGPVHYNDAQLQVMDNNIATCGRYVALFLKNNHMKVEDFVDEIFVLSELTGMTPDQFVTAVTLPYEYESDSDYSDSE